MYVTHRDGIVRGFYTLAAGSVSSGEAPIRVKAGGGSYDVPVVVLARLAVDLREQGRGVGKGLVRDAMLRVAAAGDLIGVRAVLVHLKHPGLIPFYTNLDFESSPVDQGQMFLLMKDLRRAIV